jgi:hypothetical protein
LKTARHPGRNRDNASFRLCTTAPARGVAHPSPVPSLLPSGFIHAPQLAAKTADADAFRINPGLANPSQWQQVAFKGGSEGGVLNLTTALTGKDGKHYCVAATWNNTAALNQAKIFATHGSILNTLATGGRLGNEYPLM